MTIGVIIDNINLMILNMHSLPSQDYFCHDVFFFKYTGQLYL